MIHNELSQDNPYAAPGARLAVEEAPVQEMAERGTRLAAKLIDGLTGLVLLVPIIATMPFMSSSGQAQDDSVALGVMFALLTLVALGLIAVNCVLLHRHGQTVGKKAMGIRIVRSDGSRCGLGRVFGLRYLPVAFLGAIPFVGTLVSLTDILMIFGEERRCLHDLFADTIVVKA